MGCNDYQKYNATSKTINEEYLLLTEGLLIDRSVRREKGLSLFAARGKANGPDDVRNCTEIHEICITYLLN